MDKPVTIHDNFLRSILADKGIAIDYFRAALPSYILKKLDFTTLVQLPDTYISKELRKTISDIVYSCNMKGGGGSIKISLLIEHKSYVDKYTPIQIGSYIFSGLLKQISSKEKQLSLIIPILLYHGKETWQYKSLKDLFEDPDPELHPFIPDYEYIYHNLGEISDDAIQALNNKFLAASFLALKYSRIRNKLERWIPAILTIALGDGRNLQNDLIVYIFESSGLKEDRILEIVQSLPGNLKDAVMSTMDIFVEKGRKEGRHEEREKAVRNLVKQSLLSDQQIAAALEVSTGYVADIRKALGNEK